MYEQVLDYDAIEAVMPQYETDGERGQWLGIYLGLVAHGASELSAQAEATATVERTAAFVRREQVEAGKLPVVALKHLAGQHDQRRHAPHPAAQPGHGGGYGEAFDKVGTEEPYIDEGPTGWTAGSGDITRVDYNVLVPVKLLRSDKVDVVRQAGLRSTRTFEYRERLRKEIEEQGLKQGISVAVEQDGRISILDGTHRLEAVDALGWEYIPATEVRYFGNVQREGLISMETAEKHLPGQHDQRRHGVRTAGVSGHAAVDPLQYRSDGEYALHKLGIGYGPDGSHMQLVNGKFVKIDRQFTAEEFDAMRRAETEWEVAVLKAIGRGDVKIDLDDLQRSGSVTLHNGALDGVRFSHQNLNQGTPGEMPTTLYHVTTAKSAILANDGTLKSRYDLDMERARGLGGGAEETISFTTDSRMASTIQDAMIEAHQVASGKMTFWNMLAQAEMGQRADRSWDEDWVHIASGDNSWKSGQDLPVGLQQLVDGYQVQSTGLGYAVADVNRLASEGQYKWASAEGYGDWEPVDAGWLGGDGRQYYGAFRRKMPDAQYRKEMFDLYKTWSGTRDHAGGPSDPLFWATDADYLGRLDPSDIAILEYKSKPGTIGVQMGSLAEWRTWDGSALELTDVTESWYTEKQLKPELALQGGSQSIRVMVSGGMPGEDDVIETTNKHLAGQHDQSRHAPSKSGADEPENQLEQALRSAEADVLEYGKRTGREMIAVVLDDGSTLSAEGTTDRAVLPEFEGHAYAMVHNHPSSASFTGKDFYVFSENNISKSVLLGHDGSRFELTKGPAYQYQLYADRIWGDELAARISQAVSLQLTYEVAEATAKRLGMDYSAGQVVQKHLPGRHNQRMHTPTSKRTWAGGVAVEYEEKVRLRAAAYGPIAQAVTASLRNKYPDADDEKIEADADMVLDVMALDKERFMHYGTQYGVPNPEQACEEFFKHNKEIDRQAMLARMRYQDRATITMPGSKHVNWTTNISQQLEDAVEPLVGSTYADAANALRDKYGIDVQIKPGTLPGTDEQLHRELSWLVNLGEVEPAIGTLLRNNVKQVIYAPVAGGSTAAAQAGGDKIWVRTLHKHPSSFPGIWPGVWVHELGHIAQDRYENDDTKAAMGKGMHVSSYAWTNPNEDFAETFTAAFSDNSAYREQAGAKMDVMDGVVARLRSETMTTEKHLPGQHDQSKHGRRIRFSKNSDVAYSFPELMPIGTEQPAWEVQDPTKVRKLVSDSTAYGDTIAEALQVVPRTHLDKVAEVKPVGRAILNKYAGRPPIDLIDGTTLPDGRILLRGQMPLPVAQFTTLHEVGHAVMHSDAETPVTKAMRVTMRKLFDLKRADEKLPKEQRTHGKFVTEYAGSISTEYAAECYAYYVSGGERKALLRGLDSEGYAAMEQFFNDTTGVQVAQKHLPGQHDQRTHGRPKGSAMPSTMLADPALVKELADPNSQTNQEARANWANLSHEKRMALMEPAAVDTSMANALSTYREEPYKPAHRMAHRALFEQDIDAIADNARQQIKQLEGAYSPTTKRMMSEYITQTRQILQQGLKDKSITARADDIDAMIRANIDKLTFQEIETRKRQLGDHGIRHVVYNMLNTNAMLDQLPNTTGADKLLAMQVMADHDMGYTAGVVTHSLEATKYHEQFSAKYAKAMDYSKVFGDRTNDLVDYVATHADSDLDWEKAPLASAIRTADNLALFSKEKLPVLFADVPGAMGELYKLQLANTEGKDAAAKLVPSVKASLQKLLDKSKIDPRQKAELQAAIEEVGPYTGKFTLGMDAGELKGFRYKDGVMEVDVANKVERELLNGVFDLGDRQFSKFLEAYDNDGTPDDGLDLMPKGSNKSVLRIFYSETEKPKPSPELLRLVGLSVRPAIRYTLRSMKIPPTQPERDRVWPQLEKQLHGRMTPDELRLFRQHFDNDTLDKFPLTTRERQFVYGEQTTLKHMAGRHDQQRHAPVTVTRGSRNIPKGTYESLAASASRGQAESQMNKMAGVRNYQEANKKGWYTVKVGDEYHVINVSKEAGGEPIQPPAAKEPAERAPKVDVPEGHEIKSGKYAGPDLTGSGNKHQMQVVTNALKVLPKVHQQALYNVNVHNTNDLNAIGISSVVAAGHAIIERRTINLAGYQHSDDELAMVAVHETAHIVMSYKGLPDASEEYERSMFDAKHKLERIYNKRAQAVGLKPAPVGSGWTPDEAYSMGAITPYAASNSTEYVAENYAYYVRAPKVLKRQDPEAYAVLKEFFEGQEY